MPVDLNTGLFTLQTVIKEPLPPIEWDIEPLIAHGNRVVVYGEFGCGKSWALLDLAIHLALGHPWLDRFTIASPRSVLYLDEEMPNRTLRTRLKKLSNGLGLSDSTSIPLWLASHIGLKLTSAFAIQDLLNELERRTIDPDVIVVETLRRVIAGGENDAEDVGRMWEAIEPLVKADKTLILSHHMRKPGANGAGQTRHKASGSTDILAGADAGFAITRTTKNSMIIECVKSRVVEEPPPFSVGVFDVPERLDATELRYLANNEEAEKEASKLEVTINHLLAYAQKGLSYKTAELEAAITGFGISKSTVQRAMQECKRRGMLCNEVHGSWKVPDPTIQPA